MKIKIITALICIIAYSTITKAQFIDSANKNLPINAANSILKKTSEDNRFSIGCYAQLEYTQQFNDTAAHNSLIDVHRLVTFMGYRFTDRAHFVTEIEFEHVNEATVEQAFLNFQIKKWIDFRAGLILIPMGIINEYHEPTTFNGVLRPNLDNKIVPTTWREIGAGFTGTIDNLSLKYQLYTVNGFNGYDGGGKFKGDDGLRGGRQKGIKSYMTAPDFSGKVDYYGINGLKLGIAAYMGQSESKLKEGLWKDDSLKTAQLRLDSSMVGINMIGADVRYQFKGFEARAQFILANISNTEQYNAFTKKDLGSKMSGYYVEAGYNVLTLFNVEKYKLTLFGRYENYNTHAATDGDLKKNDAYNRTDITLGAGFKVANGAVFKADYQNRISAKSNDVAKHFLNLGVGIWF